MTCNNDFSTHFQIAGKMPIGLISLIDFATGDLVLLSRRVRHMNQYLGMVLVTISVAILSATTSLTLIPLCTS